MKTDYFEVSHLFSRETLELLCPSELSKLKKEKYVHLLSPIYFIVSHSIFPSQNGPSIIFHSHSQLYTKTLFRILAAKQSSPRKQGQEFFNNNFH